MSNLTNDDIDVIETDEWIQSIESVIHHDGIRRAKYLLKCMLQHLNKYNSSNLEDYINTIHHCNEPKYPGNLEIENRINAVIRWNAIMIVLNAYNKNLDLGGHISSFQSISTIYEVCFNHFFRARNDFDGGDLIYFQGHSAPGIYARAFLEGRLTKKQIDNFRQEIDGYGLPSYPHPKLMPDFWQFPTVSMGLGAINGIYQAKFLKYLQNRSIKDTSRQTVYVFLGDGEMDEPESKGAINIAVREKLDNLIFIINCNLQRLDGPVIGNGKIINELSNMFTGAGWEVIKVIWGSNWDTLLNKDYTGKLIQLMNETLDGDYQTLRSKDGAYIRKYFFGKYPETKLLVKNMTDNEIWQLIRGGHDTRKIYAALSLAKNIIDKPVVILLHTIKGYGLGKPIESANIAHQVKYIDSQSLDYIKKKLNLHDLITSSTDSLPYIKFSKNSVEYHYLHNKRKNLYGYLPSRLKNFTEPLILPALNDFHQLLIKQTTKLSTTTAFVKILNILLKNKAIGNRIVPIIADEARTFGMEGLFKQVGIYNSQGQKYTAQDKDYITTYYEHKNGQIIQEGISELGAASSWLAAATSYSNNDLPMIPFYIYYSIFGFQRIGDLCWAAGDQQARGFLIGGVSGKTTLNGEGLQHADGHSHVQSLIIPNCLSYDPAYSYELAVIIHNGLVRMYGKKQENIYYYITILNEDYTMPNIPDGIEYSICKGIYKLETLSSNSHSIGAIQLMGSGALLRYVRKAAQILSQDYNISVDVYSVTSFTELARDGQDCYRWNRLHPKEKPKIPFLNKIINNNPVVIVTDYMKILAEQIRQFIPNKHVCILGTDGFGRSDSRKKLRDYFEISTGYIIVSVLYELALCNITTMSMVQQAINKFNINANKINPRLV
ncbi:MAG: pyruvate dehydrogenase (acetyl-transferring), homodimeric type [Candidatus Lightella neohaematopini]|nr:pyruvate dehydrogenase (acetyl-transferring), homodimeric type [Candidatus Lightella neohaematopini]